MSSSIITIFIREAFATNLTAITAPQNTRAYQDEMTDSDSETDDSLRLTKGDASRLVIHMYHILSLSILVKKKNALFYLFKNFRSERKREEEKGRVALLTCACILGVENKQRQHQRCEA